MATQAINSLTSQLATPINEAMHQAHAGQFALMLSLLFEERFGPSGFEQGNDVLQPTVRPVNDLVLDSGFGIALAAGSSAQFNLLKGLYLERMQYQLSHAEPVKTGDLDVPQRRSTDRLLEEIEYGKRFSGA